MCFCLPPSVQPPHSQTDTTEPQIGNLIEARRFFAQAETTTSALRERHKQQQQQQQEASSATGGSGDRGGSVVALAEAQVRRTGLRVCWVFWCVMQDGLGRFD